MRRDSERNRAGVITRERTEGRKQGNKVAEDERQTGEMRRREEWK
jgi:hypothetical protein